MVVPVSNPNQLMPHSVSGCPSSPMICPLTVVRLLADSARLLCGGAGGGSAALCMLHGAPLMTIESGMPDPLPTCMQGAQLSTRCMKTLLFDCKFYCCQIWCHVSGLEGPRTSKVTAGCTLGGHTDSLANVQESSLHLLGEAQTSTIRPTAAPPPLGDSVCQ